MTSAKDLVIKPIKANDANRIIKNLHYSGKVVPNSQLHFGVFLNGVCGGAMQFGPSMKKEPMMKLVEGTGWNDFIELNRMAFADWLPRNSESRAIAYTMRYIKKQYPHIKWVVTFADGTQCGDGTIYRASGFVLTDIRHSKSLRINPVTGEIMHAMQAFHLMMGADFKTWEVPDGFQMRYVFFIDPTWRARLQVPELPFSKIEEMGASLYRGERPGSIISDVSDYRSGEGSANLTSGLEQVEA